LISGEAKSATTRKRNSEAADQVRPGNQSQDRESARPDGVVRSYWLHKGIIFIAVALLIALALTQFARYGSTIANHAAAGGAMGRGGQFEKAHLPKTWLCVWLWMLTRRPANPVAHQLLRIRRTLGCR
jgi:hypothetical protein